MIGDVATAISAKTLSTNRRRVDKHVGKIGVCAECVNVWMFEQQQPVVAAVLEERVL
ncbi:unannotated protein [freshwater metagenome]|uniref:Unannotated protein n=1 Tax=freshwater metagenome TaxID=449393 RepID=A0A6J6Y3T7_9ZZZZ